MIELTITFLLGMYPDRVFDPKFEHDCFTIQSYEGYEAICPNRFDYTRAEYVKRLPPLLLPGHASDGSMVASNDIPALPVNCALAVKTFYEKAAQLSYFLQRQKNDFDPKTLTREAAYSVEQIVKGYHMQVSREAKAKKSYSSSDDEHSHTSCATHANVGTREIYRLGDVLIYELNKGNYGLKNTGLNPYSK